MPEIPPLPRRGLGCGFFPGARGSWSLPSFRYDGLEEGSMPVPIMQPRPILSTAYITQQRPRIKTKFPSPGGTPGLLLKNSVEKFHGASGTRGAPRPRVVRENDCCFILGEAVGPKGVRRISFFPRLFLDSPTGTPYLVCVINIHHKIRYH